MFLFYFAICLSKQNFCFEDKHTSLTANRQFIIIMRRNTNSNDIKDHEKDWIMFKRGFFILTSNKEDDCTKYIGLLTLIV